MGGGRRNGKHFLWPPFFSNAPFFDYAFIVKLMTYLILEERGAEGKSKQKVTTREECSSSFLVTIKDADLTWPDTEQTRI